MLQIGAGDVSKFEFLRLGILLRSFGSEHFWSQNGQKWKVTESLKTCSWDVLGAQRVLLSDFKTRQWPLHDFWKSCIFAIFEWFSVATRMLQCHRGFHWGVLRTSSCARSTGAPTWCEAPLLGVEIGKKRGGTESIQKTRFLGILTCLYHSS